jgi:hypothetical protein
MKTNQLLKTPIMAPQHRLMYRQRQTTLFGDPPCPDWQVGVGCKAHRLMTAQFHQI